MSESLVPKDRPYGERKALREQMQAGGIPTEPRTGEPTVGAPAPVGPRPASQVVPSNYDVFANREPSEAQFPHEEGYAEPPRTIEGQIIQTAASAPNPFVREFASRLAQLRGGANEVPTRGAGSGASRFNNPRHATMAQHQERKNR